MTGPLTTPTGSLLPAFASFEEVMAASDAFFASCPPCAHECGREGLVNHADDRVLCLPCYSAGFGLDDPREPSVIAAAERCKVCNV